MFKIKRRPAYNVLQAPYIKVDTKITQVGITNGKPNIQQDYEYVIAPSAKKIATYIVNQIFGSELVTQTEGLSVNWLMPTLKEVLELCVYQGEAFVYIKKYNNKVYLECYQKNEIHDLVQKYDEVSHAVLIDDFESDDENYRLRKIIDIENGITYMKVKAYSINKDNSETEISLDVFNYKTDSTYLPQYILPYEILVNIDIGQDFFKDSKKFLNSEMEVVNTLIDEIEKTKTRIATSQHYQSGDLVTNWVPGSTHYKVDSISVGKLQDYFTLLPGDKDHQIFEFLQGNIRTKDYQDTFKFYDYQIIQMAGLSPASFGYEKDSYMNVDNVDLSKNNSDMTIEAIKNQIEEQLNRLFTNVYKIQTSQNISTNNIPEDMNWNFGANEKFDDMKKIQVLNRLQNIGSIPYSYKAKIIMPILNKLIDDDFAKDNEKLIDDFLQENQKEEDSLKIEYGEI